MRVADCAPAAAPPWRHAGLGGELAAGENYSLAMSNVGGKRVVAPRQRRSVTVRKEIAIGALAVKGRFAVHLKWSICLLPTMSPCEPSKELWLPEHPAEGFA